MEVTWLVLAQLDLNPSYFGLVALVFTSHGEVEKVWGQ